MDKMIILDADNNEVQFEMTTLGYSNEQMRLSEGDIGISNSQAYLKSMTGYLG
jgi:hypothetical protein